MPDVRSGCKNVATSGTLRGKYPPRPSDTACDLGPASSYAAESAGSIITWPIARHEATWYIGKKLDFTSDELLTVHDSNGDKWKFKFPLHGDTLEWVD